MDKDEARHKDDEERLRKLFVGALPKNLSDGELKAYFVQFGEVEKAYVVKNPKTAKTRGFGFVVYKNIEDFEKVMAQEVHIIKDKVLYLRRTQTRKEMYKIKEEQDPRKDN